MERRLTISARAVADVVIPVGVLVVLAVLFWIARGALIPFVLGIVIAYAIAPAIRAVEGRQVGGRRVSRTLAIVLIYGVALACIVGLVWVILPPLLAQIRQLIAASPGYLTRVQTLYAGIEGWYLSLDLNPDLRREIDGWLGSASSAGLDIAQDVGLGIASATTRTIGFVFGLLLVPFWVFYVLRDQHHLGTQILNLFPTAWRLTVRDLAVIADRVLGSYLRGQLTLMVSIGLAVLVAAFILGMTVSPTVGRYALLLGVVAGLTEAIPIVGPILGGAVGVGISVVDGPSAILWTLAAYVAIQQLENTLLVPKIMGDALELNPAILIIALAVGSQIAGLTGAVLAGPLTALAAVWIRYAQARLRGEVDAGVITPGTLHELRQRPDMGQRNA